MESITPHYTNEQSKTAEIELKKLVEIGKDFGVDIMDLRTSREEIIEVIKNEQIERYELVIQKLKEEGLSLEDLSENLLLDRMLGIDILFRFQSKIFAIDVTTGKNTVVINKNNKFKKMEDLYKKLGIDHAIVLKLKKEITDDIFVDLFSKLENITPEFFTSVIKYQ